MQWKQTYINPMEEQKLLILFVRSAVSSQNIQISLLTKIATLAPAINKLSVFIFLSMLRTKTNLEAAKRLCFLF